MAPPAGGRPPQGGTPPAGGRVPWGIRLTAQRPTAATYVVISNNAGIQNKRCVFWQVTLHTFRQERTIGTSTQILNFYLGSRCRFLNRHLMVDFRPFKSLHEAATRALTTGFGNLRSLLFGGEACKGAQTQTHPETPRDTHRTPTTQPKAKQTGPQTTFNLTPTEATAALRPRPRPE